MSLKHSRWVIRVGQLAERGEKRHSPDDGTATRERSIQFGWSDVGASTYNLKMDGVVYTVADTSKVLVLAKGVHNWTVRAVDAFGVSSSYAEPWTVTVDHTAPPQPALTNPRHGAFSASVDIQFLWEPVPVDNEQGFYNLDVDGLVSTTTGTSMTLALGEGAHSWAVQA